MAVWFVTGTLLSTSCAQTAKVPQPLLLTANQDDRSLSLIDPTSGKQIASAPVDGITGHEVAASPDGKTAYVPIYGDSGVGRPGTDHQDLRDRFAESQGGPHHRFRSRGPAALRDL